MKKMMRYISCVLMLTLHTSMYAQTPVKNQDPIESKNDLSAKKSLKAAYQPRAISWWDCGNGFIYKYTIENIKYMTRYDKQGNYIETLIQKVWNDSSSLRPSFQQSQFKQQKVIGYWEVADENKKGYYLEMSDGKNQVSSVWVDDQGNFSTIPTVKAKQ